MNRLALTLLVCLGVAAAAAVTLRGAAAGPPGLVRDPVLGVDLPAPKAAALAARRARVSRAESPEPAPVPPPRQEPPAVAEGVHAAADVPVPISPRVLDPTSAWLHSGPQGIEALYAGADPADDSTGLVILVREDASGGGQSVRAYRAAGSGPLAIEGVHARSVVLSSRGGWRSFDLDAPDRGVTP